jgi:hypothetical protein
MMNDKEHKEFRLQTIIHSLQLIVLLVGVATIFTTIGKRDQQISDTAESLGELQSIVHELVKSQVAGATKDAEHDRILENLNQRIYRLETQGD